MCREKMQPCIRINPEERLCPAYDYCCVKLFPIAKPDRMGFWVVDNFPEEHIQ